MLCFSAPSRNLAHAMIDDASATLASPPQPASRYGAPALEKGLDVLEAVADAPDGLTLTELAKSLGRSSSQLYRMVLCLHERGYLNRDVGDRYGLSARLFELVHRHPPNRSLLQHALPLMRHLAEQTGQSCHLGQLHGQRLIVIAAVDSPAACGVNVRSGSSHRALDTASGRLLQYWSDVERGVEEPAAGLKPSEAKAIGRDGVFKYRSRTHHGVIDLCASIREQHRVVAVLTVPLLTRRDQSQSIAGVAEAVREAAAKLTQALGGPTDRPRTSRSPVI